MRFFHLLSTLANFSYFCNLAIIHTRSWHWQIDRKSQTRQTLRENLNLNNGDQGIGTATRCHPKFRYCRHIT